MKNCLSLRTDSSGIALYVSMLVASLVLTIGLSMANIFLKEYQLSVAARDSQIAFYAADSGIECADYYDTIAGGSYFASTSAADIICNGQSGGGQAMAQYAAGCGPPFTQMEGSDYYQKDSLFGCPTSLTNDRSIFTIYFGAVTHPISDNDLPLPCAVIEVNKTYISDDYQTSIVSLGYNNCQEGNPRRIERGIIVQH